MGFPFVSGMYFLIFHSAVNNVGQELYEAAVIDGATSWQVAWKIHVPNVMGYVTVIATLSLIGSLSGFGAIAATTGGGPGNATMIPAMLIYRVAFTDGRFGYASAMGTIMMIVIMVLTVLQRKLTSSKEA
jgi:raffinose/stachyose/melibiose transport system permease protein